MVLALAPITSKIRLGVQVIGNLFRHPVITAKMMNALDHISNGRADIGLGAGWSKMEHAAHGMAFPGLAERIERMEESITLMKALFTEERATFEGKYYQVYEVPFDPKPVQKPHPPIMIGGINDASLRVAARHANDWSSLGPRLEIQERALRLKEICEEEERDFSSIRASHQVPSCSPMTGRRSTRWWTSRSNGWSATPGSSRLLTMAAWRSRCGTPSSQGMWKT